MINFSITKKETKLQNEGKGGRRWLKRLKSTIKTVAAGLIITGFLIGNVNMSISTAAAGTMDSMGPASTIENRLLIHAQQEDYKDRPHYIFIGDSRFVGMESALSQPGSDTFICKCAMGLDWFREQMQGRTFGDNDILVIGFGINDIHNLYNYIAYVNSLKINNNVKNVYWLTVNPVDESKELPKLWPITNAEIQLFNLAVKANAVNYKVIDTYNALMEHGYHTDDGAHYDDPTNIFIHDYAVAAISQDMAMGN